MVLVLIGCYLLGSVPFGVYAGRVIAGVDVRRFGSGNTGATNVMRVLGAKPAILVLLLDVVKGAGAVVIGRVILGGEVLPLACGLVAVAGHNWSPFLRFQGGKGVAATLGVVLAGHPIIALTLFGLFAAIVATTRYVSLGSIVSALLIPVSAWLIGASVNQVLLYALLAAMAIYRHKANLIRLSQGAENRIGRS